MKLLLTALIASTAASAQYCGVDSCGFTHVPFHELFAREIPKHSFYQRKKIEVTVVFDTLAKEILYKQRFLLL